MEDDHRVDRETIRQWHRNALLHDFSHLDDDAFLATLDTIRSAYEEDKKIRELSRTLEDQLLIVPGNNEINSSQLSTLLWGYLDDKDFWDSVIDVWKVNKGE